MILGLGLSVLPTYTFGDLGNADGRNEPRTHGMRDRRNLGGSSSNEVTSCQTIRRSNSKVQATVIVTY